MTSNPDPNSPVNVALYEAQLRRQHDTWRAQLEYILHSDRAAIDLGITTLKTGILINAGALVAVLALVGQLWKDKQSLISIVLSTSRHFVWGLIAVAAGSAAAYFYQSFVTWSRDQKLKEISTNKLPRSYGLVRKGVWCFGILMVILVLAGYVEFTVGVLSTMKSLHP